MNTMDRSKPDLDFKEDEGTFQRFSIPENTLACEVAPHNLDCDKALSSKSIHKNRKVSKSSSLGSVQKDVTKPIIIDQNDIIALTHNVKSFSEELAKLKASFSHDFNCGDDCKIVAHERLGEVLCILKSVLQDYPALHSSDLFSSAATLIAAIKGHNYDEQVDNGNVQSLYDVIDQLALAFSSSVSEYLMGDGISEEIINGKTKSYDNLSDIEQGHPTDSATFNINLEGSHLEDTDFTLLQLDTGLDVTVQRAKAWIRYAREIMTYIEKKSQLESEYAKGLLKLVQVAQQNLAEEAFLPLQSIYCTALNQDMEYASNCQATQTLFQTNRFIEPLLARRSDLERVRKFVKEVWIKEMKKMHEATHNLRKAQCVYINRQEEYEKMKAEKENPNKLKKLEDEARHRAAEAETTYKACIAETNYLRKELENVKADLLNKLKKELKKCDEVMKTVTVEYFQLLHTVTAPLPVQYHTLCEASKKYEVGSQFSEFVRRLPSSNLKPDLFVFEPFSSAHSLKNSQKGNTSASSDKNSQNKVIPFKAWGQNFGMSDTDSASSSRSLDSSPCSSPLPLQRHHTVASSLSLEELNEGKKGLTVGDEVLDVPGILKHQKGRRNTTFGVDFQEQVTLLNVEVPPIIIRCVQEVEKRGLKVKGLYRVSGVKSKVENLCQRFELDPSTVDLNGVHPNVLSSVLKQYLRHLPEPLLTFKLYPEFIRTAKNVMEGIVTHEQGIEQLKNITQRLPISNLKTCAVLMNHLHRVASCSDLNQMSAANLGIVFGPTLLKPYEGLASLASLVDTPHQTLTVEMMISSAKTIFGGNDCLHVFDGENKS